MPNDNKKEQEDKNKDHSKFMEKMMELAKPTEEQTEVNN